MGIDVYVGSLSRFYARDWDTITQTLAKQQGMDAAVYYPDGEPDQFSQDDVRPKIFEWRDAVKKSLSEPVEYNWDESSESPYFTDKPDWAGYASLLLWAAYSEHQDMDIPEGLDENWNADPALSKSLAPEFKTHYPALFMQMGGVWIPEDVPFAVATLDIFGNEIEIGSIYKLGSELVDLNDRTWKADENTITKWLNDGPGDGTSIEKEARFCFSVFLDLANKAIKNNLVMTLDY